MKNLQKIFFIKRFIGKNSNAIHKFTKKKSLYKIIIMFSDELDEEFFLINSLKTK